MARSPNHADAAVRPSPTTAAQSQAAGAPPSATSDTTTSPTKKTTTTFVRKAPTTVGADARRALSPTPVPAPTTRGWASAGPLGGRLLTAARAGALPVGKGMYIYVPEHTENGDIATILKRAEYVGLTHLYVRTGSSWDGFYAQDFLNALLPAAHAAGLRVYGWDFPNLNNWQVDVARSLAAINYTTPSGDRIDGFAADIETQSEGTNLNANTVLAYGTGLRQGVGYGYPLIAVVPRPPYFPQFPYREAAEQFDAFAPMVYWMDRDAGGEVAAAVDDLAQWGKPVFPIGQTYNGAPEGGPVGPPRRNEILRFMEVAEAHRAPGVSFWDWQEASQEDWDAIRDASQFVLPIGRQNHTGGRNILVQWLLKSIGYGAQPTGDWDPFTVSAVQSFQAALGLAPTGEIDPLTSRALLTPVAPPIRPMRH